MLNEGKKILFSGTPCQIGGLYGFLGKDYENLFTIDVICHAKDKEKYPDVKHPKSYPLEHFIGDCWGIFFESRAERIALISSLE